MGFRSYESTGEKPGILFGGLKGWPPTKILDFKAMILNFRLFTVLLQMKLNNYSFSFRKRLNMTALFEYLDLLLQDIGQKVGAMAPLPAIYYCCSSLHCFNNIMITGVC